MWLSPNGDVGIEGKSGSDGKGKWSEMVRACVEEGWWARKALEIEVKGKRKRGRPKKMWEMQVEKERKSVGLEKEDALNQARWRVGVWEIAVWGKSGHRCLFLVYQNWMWWWWWWMWLILLNLLVSILLSYKYIYNYCSISHYVYLSFYSVSGYIWCITCAQ